MGKRNRVTMDMREMFSRIAARYGLMNRLITLGQDSVWKRYAVLKARLPEGGRLLDVGTGTGDLALEAARRDPKPRITGVDITLEMIREGYGRSGGQRIDWCLADASKLPFDDTEFDAVISGYLIRNLKDAVSAFKEQVRVVRPGGMVVCLDTSPVPRNILRPILLLYMNMVIPLLGLLVTGHGDAYRYLPDSTQRFMGPERLGSVMRSAGLKNVRYRQFMFGTISVHWGVRSK